MDSIKSQVETLVNETAVQKPLGQRLLDVGFKRVREKELFERFRCAEITIELKKKAERESLAFFDKKCEELRPIKTWFGTQKYHVEHKRELYSGPDHYSVAWGEHPGWREHAYNVKTSGFERFPLFECTLDYCSLENYMDDKIPEDCLIAIEKAKSIGLTSFKVVYPVIGKTVQKDPVIVDFLGEQMIEIAWWE